MPTLSVWTVRAALLWLAVASLAGALILARGSLGHPELALWIPRHAEMMLMGWMVQLAFGVAHWILPRPPAPTGRDSGIVVVVAIIALDLGLVLVVLGSPIVGRLLEAWAVVLFAGQAVPRIRASTWGATGKEDDLVRLTRPRSPAPSR